MAELLRRLVTKPLSFRVVIEKYVIPILVVSLACASHAGVTTNLLVNFNGSLDGIIYTLGMEEIDTTGTFGVNGFPAISGGQAVLNDDGDGFYIDPTEIGSLTTTNWVAEAVVAFDRPLAISVVIDVQGDVDFRVNPSGNGLQALYWDGATSGSVISDLPPRLNFIHLALVWEPVSSSLTAYTNGVAIGTIDNDVFNTPDTGNLSFGYFGRSGYNNRGIDGLLHAVSFATSDAAILPADFLITTLPPPPPPPPPLLPVDPRIPSERPADLRKEWARWPQIHIRELEAERDRLLQKISVLPHHNPFFPANKLGYHSIFHKPDSEARRPPCQIDFKWPWAPLVDSIALVPAFNAKEPGAYAFPKRFKIEIRPTETNEFETVVDWMEEDYPDPGLYPVFFAGINRYAKQVRITMPPVVSESGIAYSALGEVYVLQQRPNGSTGGNMAAWGRGHVEVEAFDSFSLPPLWDVQYLNDGLVGLGFPLSDETVESKDLMIIFDSEEAPNEVQLLLDLGREQDIGRIDFWPASPPDGLALPSVGFPTEISVELSPDPEFKTVEVLTVESAPDNMMIRENLLSIAAGAYEARYLRITMRGLPEVEGKRILGLGEILVTQFETVLSANCKVTAKGIPKEQMNQLPLLVDGCSWHRRILPQGEWIKGLAQRRPLDQRLAVVERELELARADWRRIKQRSGVWAGIIVVLGLVGGLVVQRQIRKRGLKKLKWRIARDLHDDVGSNLGGITLVTEKLKQVAGDEESTENLKDLTLLAHEAYASLREIVWVMDEGTICLPALIKKLVERAERILGGVELFIDASNDYPDCIVSLTFKRHLIMFFKEVVHNCAFHSGATQVWVDFTMVGQSLQISVRDNGCGFDSSEKPTGWGLCNMKERAEELGGEMELVSLIGKGTTIILKIPLASMAREPSNAYKTSN